jgi:hypothetical protein
MPPKKNAVPVSSGRPARGAKTVAAKVISKATSSGRRQAPPSTPPPPSPSQPGTPHTIDAEALAEAINSHPQLNGIETRFQNLESTMDDNQRELRRTIQDTFAQFMDRFDSFERQHPTPVTPTNPGTNQGNPPNPFGAPVDVLSRWPWVDQKLVEDVANGQFDIHNLPKLHREEEPRTTNSKKTTEGIHIPADGGIPQIMTGRTKMSTAFPNVSIFMSAWMIYVSIRSSFANDRGPGLTHWTERLVQYSLKFEWSSCVNYAIEYFTKHQNASPDAWFSIDPEIVIGHFIASKRIMSSGPSNSATTGSFQRPQSPKKPLNGEVCQNWNRPLLGCTYRPRHEGDKCPRRHVCSTCLKSDHKAHECPPKQKSSN